MGYETVIRNIIDATQRVIGDVAVRQAATVDGIDYEEDAVQIRPEAASKELVADLVAVYESILGAAGIGIAKRAVADSTVELPEILD